MENIIKSVKVEAMKSPRSGQPVPNQVIITTPDGRYFQSYDSIIAFIPAGSTGDEATDPKITLDANAWDYSSTTSKYRNAFLGESKKDTEKKIKAGIYVLADLNA